MPRVSGGTRRRGRPRIEYWLPIVCLVCIVGGAALLWSEIENGERQRLQLETEVTAEQMRLRLEAWIDSRIGVVDYLGNEWQRLHAGRPEAFQDAAGEVLERYPGFQAINWVDADWVIRIIAPEAGNEPALNKDLHDHPNPGVSAAISRAVATRRIAATPALELLQGGLGFATYRPIHDTAGKLTGFINAVFRIDTLVDTCLAERNLHARFRFDLAESGGEVVHRRPAVRSAGDWPYETDVEIRFVDRVWTMRLAPSPRFLAEVQSSADELMLAAAAALAIVVAWLSRLLLVRHRALRESEARYRSLFEHAPVCLWEEDYSEVEKYLDRLRGDGVSDFGRYFADHPEEVEKCIALIRVIDVNQAALALHDASSKRELADGLARTLTAESYEAFLNVLVTVADGGNWYGCEAVVQTLSGERRHVDLSLFLASRGSTSWPVAYVAIKDNTLRKRAQEENTRLETQLRQAQKMEAIGQLAGGVAHDFNNILTAVLGNTELALDELQKLFPDGANIIETVRQIAQNAQRATVLTRQLLAFSRQQVAQPQVLHLGRTLSDMEDMLRRLISENIALRIDCAPGLWSVHADPGHIEQVIMNLVVNARDAMAGGGQLHIATDNVTVDAGHAAAQSGAASGPYVVLTVRDSGCGMDAPTLERVFEPFFTTKGVGQGTGLGLATVYGIVKQTGGHITVDSEPGRGTRFQVYLPATTAVHEPPHEPEIKTGVRGGSESILICEDDKPVRDLTSQILRHAGYTVLSAANGEEALDLVAHRSEPIDLLITDVIMPNIDGRQLADALAAAQPTIRTLFVSGYTANVIAQHGVLDPGVEFLEKPFRADTLLQRVRQTLDAAARTTS